MAQEGRIVESLFRVMLDPLFSSQRLRLPYRFVSKCGDQLSNDITVLVADGRQWHLQLTKEGESLYFDRGLREFVEYYSVGRGYFVLFNFKGDSTFYVQIYDLSTCEIEYPRNSVQNRLCMFGDIVDAEVTPAIDKENEKPSSSIEEIVISPDSSEATIEERGKAFDDARALKSDFPVFVTKIRKYNVVHPYALHIPRQFSKDNPSIKKRKYIQVEDSNGKKLHVHCIKDRGQIRTLGKGWPAFVKKKRLKVGDACVFELVRTDDPTFRVSIFRSEKED